MDLSWLDALKPPDYIWEYADPPATEQDIEEFESYVGRPLPEDYRALLRRANGGGLRYRDYWYFRLLAIAEVPEHLTGYGFDRRMPGALLFGNDGGGEGFVFDLRSEHPDGRYPILAVNYVSIGWNETIYVAPDIRSLMQLQHGLLAGWKQRQSPE